MVKCACISKLEINGEMFPGSSGVTAPIGVQFLSKFVEILSALVVLTTSNKTAMLFASCGCRVVSVALSLKAPYPVSQQYSLTAAFKETARLFHDADKLVVS
jgi:hypothetical protein